MNDFKRKRDNNDGGGGGGPRRQRPNTHGGGGGGGWGGGNHSNHRFGRVMSQPPKLKSTPNTESSASASTSTCHPTVSIAIPGSVVSNAQTRELQTQLAGQIARAAAVFRIDEIVVFDDGLGSKLNTFSNYRRGPRREDTRTNNNDDHQRKDNNNTAQEDDNDSPKQERTPREEKPAHMLPSTDPHAFLARILQYIECPQYLRRKFFPMHPDLQFAGLLPPLDAPHHLRRGDVASFREGVVVDDNDKDGMKKEGGTGGGEDEGGSFVDCGVPNKLVRIDRVLTPGIRCTVKLDPKAYASKNRGSSNNYNNSNNNNTIKKGVMNGTVVSPTTPRDEDGIYWGYTTRLASGINAIFEECPYEGGYDLKVGTSERGDVSIDDPRFCLRKKMGKQHQQQMKKKRSNNGGEDEHFNHLLIVFGGVAGIEECVDADESMALPGEDSKQMFDVWVNICPYQGSRTIRSEEAVFIALARLSPYIAKNVLSSEESSKGKNKNRRVVKTKDVEFSDEAVSEESSDEE